MLIKRLWLGALLFLACCTTFSPLPLADVNMDQMYGGWYIVATIPNWFEKGMVGPYDVFSRREDGDIREEFSVRWGSFEGTPKKYVVHDWVRPGTKNAHWRVQVFWPFNLPFLVCIMTTIINTFFMEKTISPWGGFILALHKSMSLSIGSY